MINKSFKIEDYLGKEIPIEILQQLIIDHRVTFPLGPTSTSAVSTSAEDTITEQLHNDKIQGILDHVKSMEDLIEQAEDMVDELTKDMKITPTNDSVAQAAAKLNPDGTSVITKDTLDRAMTILDNLPALTGLGDPILGALTGNSNIEGPWLQCNEITQDLADTFTRELKAKSLDTPPADQTSDMKDKHKKKMENMLLEMLNMFWWNMIWGKYLVDPLLIKPLKILVFPPDALIYFLKKFKKPTKAIIEGTIDENFKDAKGILNKIINALRTRLLCNVPKKYYKRYTPPQGVECPNTPCVKKDPIIDPTADSSKDGPGILGAMNELFPDDTLVCIDDSDDAPTLLPGEATGLGTPPDCIEAAGLVLDAVISDALTSSTPSNLGITRGN